MGGQGEMQGPASAEGLERVLNRLDTACLAVGAMIGWGWMILAGQWITQAGVIGTLIAFAVGGGIICLIGLVYAELTSALPFAGGEHVFVDHAFGPGAAFVATWAIILGYVSVVAFEAIALPIALAHFFPDIRQIPLWAIGGDQIYLTDIAIGAGVSFGFALLNIIGLKTASRVQSLIVAVILVAGLLLIFGGVLGAPQSTGPLLTDMGGVASVIIMVPFLFVGFDVIPQSAEEINLPTRKIGGVLVASVIIATLFYVGIAYGVGQAAIPAGAELAAPAAASQLWGSPTAGSIILLAGIAGILSSWNAFLIGGSRALFALGRAGQMPQALARLHPRYSTPVNAIVFIALVSALATLFGRTALVWFVDAGGFAIVIAYVFVCASFLKLRATAPQLERPFRAPGGVALGAVALLLSMALSLLYLPFAPSGLVWPYEWLIVLGWAGLGAALYAGLRRNGHARIEARLREGQE